MASAPLPASSPAQQPGLRSFIVFEEVPAGCAAYPVMSGDCEPHLHVGEMAIVDLQDCEPMEGELFLCMFTSGCGPRFVETFTNAKLKGWCVGPIQQPAFAREFGGRWCDFGLPRDVLARKLLGRVVGILEPAFSEPMRLAA